MEIERKFLLHKFNVKNSRFALEAPRWHSVMIQWWFRNQTQSFVFLIISTFFPGTLMTFCKDLTHFFFFYIFCIKLTQCHSCFRGSCFYIFILIHGCAAVAAAAKDATVRHTMICGFSLQDLEVKLQLQGSAAVGVVVPHARPPTPTPIVYDIGADIFWHLSIWPSSARPEGDDQMIHSQRPRLEAPEQQQQLKGNLQSKLCLYCAQWV